MESLCRDFENGTVSQQVLESIPEIAEKVALQEKLKYRLTIMRRVGSGEDVIVKSWYPAHSHSMIFVFTSSLLISLPQRCPSVVLSSECGMGIYERPGIKRSHI